MKISSKLNELKPTDLNCNVFDVYSYDGLSMQELLCQFFTKINECIKVSNETIDLASWLVNEGLKIEVVKKLMLWLEDGTLENLINVNLFNTLNTKIENINSQLVHNTKRIEGWINVKELGAKLDGETDETEMLKEAHDLLPEGGGKIIIPQGKMLISSKVEFTKTVIIEGMSLHHHVGETGSVILLKNDAELIFKGACSGVTKILIDGVAGNTGNGVTMLCARPWIDNITVVNQGGNGVQVGTKEFDCNVNSWYISNLRVKYNSERGLYITHIEPISSDANAGTLVALDTGSNKGDGLTLENCFDNQLIGIHSENNKGYGVNLINSANNVLLKPYIEANKLGELKGCEESNYNYILGDRKGQDYRFAELSDDNFIITKHQGRGWLFPIINKLYGKMYGWYNNNIAGVWSAIMDNEGNLNFRISDTSATDRRIKFDTIVNFTKQLIFPSSKKLNDILYIKQTISETIPANSYVYKSYPLNGVEITDSISLVTQLDKGTVFVTANILDDSGNIRFYLRNTSNESVTVNGTIGATIFKVTH